MAIKGFCNQSYGRCARITKCAEQNIISSLCTWATSCSKGHKSGVLKFQLFLGESEEFSIFWISSWPTAFNKTNTKII